MELYQLNERVYYSAYEEERDRPAIGYIRGDRFSIAIDAGHSEEHLREFYDALKEKDLPLPELTILTHWHWDHTFAMHAVNGLTLANRRTDEYLRRFIEERSEEKDKEFLKLDPSITKEYAHQKLTVVPADLVFENEITVDAGCVLVKAFRAVSPHTDDATLILLPEEKVLFFGDAISGVFPTWIADPVLKKQFIEVIEGIPCEFCIGGHWPLWKKEDLLKELKEELAEE
ncbi:MAG: MBL fold metallo-hydrolase [Erysipelotrichaceae bacterium]|nr:MBL fold metallo-hydrolase [Erysipelotrichaceae bacterium]